MADLRMRPRFQVDVFCGLEAVVGTLRERIEETDPALEGYFNAQHCMLRISRERRSFWSPELDITFDRPEDPSAGVRVRCLFGPRAGVWTGFAFVYAALAAAGFGGALLGAGQLTIGSSPWGFIATGVAVAAMGVVYGSSFIGQGLALAQMYEIRRYLDACIAEAEERARSEPRTPLDSAQL